MSANHWKPLSCNQAWWDPPIILILRRIRRQVRNLRPAWITEWDPISHINHPSWRFFLLYSVCKPSPLWWSCQSRFDPHVFLYSPSTIILKIEAWPQVLLYTLVITSHSAWFPLCQWMTGPLNSSQPIRSLLAIDLYILEEEVSLTTGRIGFCFMTMLSSSGRAHVEPLHFFSWRWLVLNFLPQVEILTYIVTLLQSTCGCENRGLYL